MADRVKGGYIGYPNNANNSAVLVAHGQNAFGTASDPKIKTITKAEQPLYFDEATEYMKTGKGAKYASTSFGDFAGLSDADCQGLFGKTLKAGGVQDTGLKLGMNTGDAKVYALRAATMTFADLQNLRVTMGWGEVVLLACRS